MKFLFRGSASIIVLAQRAWQAVAGVCTLAFVTHFLSPVEQGYFYTLASIAALHMALDMGLSAVLVQFAARMFVGLSWDFKGRVNGNEPFRFLALVRLSLCWYVMAAMILLLIYPVGLIFISIDQGSIAYDWRGPWGLLICMTAVNFLFIPVLALIEGSGEVAEVYTVRLVQGVVGAGTTWWVLLIGHGLYSVAVMPAVSAVVAAFWLYFRRSGMVVQAFRERTGGITWGKDVWPLQWRIGASWLAGYVLVIMHVPLLYRTQGPIAAGQMGVTMTVANMLSLLSMSWLTAKLPTMVQAVTTKDWVLLDQIFWRAFRVSCLTFVAGSILFVATRLILEWTSYGERFLPVRETVGLLFAMGLYHVAGLFAAYLRSHLQEPFLWPSLIGAMLTAAAAIWIAPQWGATGIVIVLMTVNGLFFFPAALGMWVHYRGKWHAVTI
jgi:hypothetical protein